MNTFHRLKTLHYAVIGGAAAAAIGIVIALYATSSFETIGAKSYTAGDFTVRILEDTSSRFLADVQNSGPRLNDAAAFVIRKGINETCEPEGVVISNFSVNEVGGRLVPNPDSIPANSKVTLDSRNVNLPSIPTGPNFETTVYILGLEQDSIRAERLVQEIPIHETNSTELEAFEACLQREDKGYPLELRITNPQKDTRVFFRITDASTSYDTGLSIGANVPDPALLFWPTSNGGWLGGNYTEFSGPAPAWKDQEQVQVSIRVVSGGEVTEFEENVTPKLVTATHDFVDVAKGDPLPAHPKFWQIDVDLRNRTIS